MLVDGAQAVSHMPVDVQALDCDFYVFSGHKVFAPTGIGVLYGKPDVLEAMPPWQGGGNMIEDVTFEKTRLPGAAGAFEAGTGNIADAVGLGAAIDYLEPIGMANIAAYEHESARYATRTACAPCRALPWSARAKEKAGVISFVLDGCRVRRCRRRARPRRHRRARRPPLRAADPAPLRLETTVRPSLALYNTKEDIDALVAALQRIAAEKGRRGL